MYSVTEQNDILTTLFENKIAALITVSNDLHSAKANLKLAGNHTAIKPAFGFHPEQVLPSQNEIKLLYQFIEDNHLKMIAIGEVGLPYYLKRKNPQLDLKPYIYLLEKFIILAKQHQKPIILHAIYEDAELACSLLEKHEIKQAHFHWFKGSQKTTKRIARNGYYISITPDVLYEKEIVEIVEGFPLEQMMVETDGPWQFTGPFKKRTTHPKMIHDVINEIAIIKQLNLTTVYNEIYQNTVRFYKLN